MVVYNAVPPPPEFTNQGTTTSGSLPAPTIVEIDAWTISALQSLSVSPVARGVGSPLSIPIDANAKKASAGRTVAFRGTTADEEYLPRRPPSRRDSQVKREALLKGKEGSRQRRRWENDRLMHVPNAQPPQPSDWEVHPTHPIHRVPYQLAQFWDRGVRERVETKAARLQAERKTQQLRTGSATGLGAGQIPRDLREASKKSPAVKGWTRSLEEPVRRYLDELRAAVVKGGEREVSSDSDIDSEDEEIVFVGRGGAMKELKEKRDRWKPARREVEHQTVDAGIVFDSFGDDETAAVKRWLVHTLADYYGLQSRSVTLPSPSRRVVYVGLKVVGNHPVAPVTHLPRPIWECC